MNEHSLSPTFTSLAAVQAWDAWFRWREQATLHDLAIEDTWQRVAHALAAGEDPAWRWSLLETMACWQLLPDESILATAGTARPAWRKPTLHAVVNVAACLGNGGAAPAIHLATVRTVATTAVRALDNAARAASAARPPRLCIGIVGLADALALAGHAYDSDPARQQAVAVMGALAAGCQRDAAAGRSATVAITPHPRLALLANEVADGIDPLAAPGHVHRIGEGIHAICVRGAGYAATRLAARGTTATAIDTAASLPRAARTRMRAVLAPWLRPSVPAPALPGAAARAAAQSAKGPLR